jgi:hypothetical protein
MAFNLNSFWPFTLDCISDIVFFCFQMLRERSHYPLRMPSFFFKMKNHLQAHPADLTLTIKSNSFRREELVKIKLRNIKRVSTAHLQLEIRKLQMSLNSTIIFFIGFENQNSPKILP